MIDILNSSQTHLSSSIHSINIAKNYHVTFMSDRFVRPAGLYHGYGPIHRSIWLLRWGLWLWTKPHQLWLWQWLRVRSNQCLLRESSVWLWLRRCPTKVNITRLFYLVKYYVNKIVLSSNLNCLYCMMNLIFVHNIFPNYFK